MGNAVVSANGGARNVALETQLKRFERSYRRRLRKLTRSTSRHGDLLFTFPAAAFALVSGRGTTDQRAKAVRLVRDGAPLAQIGEALALPSWMRRLPPEAFARPIGNVATGQAFSRKVVGRLPSEPAVAAAWLEAHEVAVGSAGEDFAYWLAGQPIYGRVLDGETSVRPLAIYAWFSNREDARGRRLMEKPWNKQMRFPVAVQQMCGWLERVVGDLTRADVKRGPGRYSRRRRNTGYEMVPLRSAAALNEEGEAMDNCVGSYAGMVAARECLIYSVRRGRTRVATMEVRWHGGRPRVWQLEGPGNTSANSVVWEAVNRWLAEQDDLILVTPSTIANLAVDATRWKALWLPYVTAMVSKAEGSHTETSNVLPLERADPRVLAMLLGDAEQLLGRTQA